MMTPPPPPERAPGWHLGPLWDTLSPLQYLPLCTLSGCFGRNSTAEDKRTRTRIDNNGQRMRWGSLPLQSRPPQEYGEERGKKWERTWHPHQGIPRKSQLGRPFGTAGSCIWNRTPGINEQQRTGFVGTAVNCHASKAAHLRLSNSP